MKMDGDVFVTFVFVAWNFSAFCDGEFDESFQEKPWVRRSRKFGSTPATSYDFSQSSTI